MYSQQATTQQYDPGAIDNFLDIKKCLEGDWEQLNSCYDHFLTNYAGTTKSTPELLAELEASRQVDVEIENSCHPMTHAIGRRALEIEGNIGDAFDACDFTCHSGCYHGVMERMFFSDTEIAGGTQHLSESQLSERVPGLCDEQNFTDPSRSVIFQCLHGIGHAILFAIDYDLHGALRICDNLSTPYEQGSCYGGVFMENVTAFDRSKRQIDFSDPHYPCNDVEHKYRRDCYQMQTSIMLEAGLSHDEIAAECSEATFPNECYVSIGRDMSSYVRVDQAEIPRKLCEEYSDKYGFADACARGVIFALIDNTWDAEYAFQFCNILKESFQPTCYNSATDYMSWSYQMDKEQLQGQCRLFAGDNLELCLASAVHTG